MTVSGTQRQTLTDPDGTPVLTYLQGVLQGRPWARDVEPVGPDPIAAILAGMSGWVITVPPGLGGQLHRHGARMMRHAHTMHLDLTAAPPPPEWASAPLPDGLRMVPGDREARELLPVWRAAFPPDHPDHYPGSDEELLRELMQPLLAGTALGPVLPCSALAVDEHDQVVAVVTVVDRDGLPWIADLFRRPDPGRAGLGGSLLRRVLAAVAAQGHTGTGLTVTDANPARRLYERLGFRIVGTRLAVLIP